MRITPEMRITEVLAVGDEMIEALALLGNELRRFREREFCVAVAEQMTVEQAARLACVALSEALYVLNITAGEEEKRLICELRQMKSEVFEFRPDNPPRKPPELIGLRDDDAHVLFIDATRQLLSREDPMPMILAAASEIQGTEVLIVRNQFDPIPLRDSLKQRGLASWAERRAPHNWFVYFYKPRTEAKTFVSRTLIMSAVGAPHRTAKTFA